MARTKIIADADGGTEVPLTQAEEAAADQLIVDRAASQPARNAREKNRQKEKLYDAHGSTVMAIIEAMVEKEEGRPDKMDAIKAARTKAKADPDWPA